ncbi:MAG: DUF932 domain-containing protein [Victivallaceae bacterium]|nr:DUF932 domain-containing protein [Victivallaceae bacterium]
MIDSKAKYATRNEIAMVPTPEATASWHPVPHVEVIDAVTGVVKDHGWEMLNEEYGLARDGRKMFGVMRINRTNSPEWTRCIGLRNSHDRTLAVGLTAGISVICCSNLAFGGSMVLKRRHTSRIDLTWLVGMAMDNLENEFLTLETVAADLRLMEVSDNLARACIIRAAELDAIPSCDVLTVWHEFKQSRHDEFAEPTKWSLLNALTEVSKKYTPARADLSHRKITRLFGLDGKSPVAWR